MLLRELAEFLRALGLEVSGKDFCFSSLLRRLVLVFESVTLLAYAAEVSYARKEEKKKANMDNYSAALKCPVKYISSLLAVDFKIKSWYFGWWRCWKGDWLLLFTPLFSKL